MRNYYIIISPIKDVLFSRYLIHIFTQSFCVCVCVCVLFVKCATFKSIFKWKNCRWREDDGRYVPSNVPLAWPERQIKKGRRRGRRWCGGNLFSYPIDIPVGYYRHTINKYLFHSVFLFKFLVAGRESWELTDYLVYGGGIRVGQFFFCVCVYNQPSSFCI